MLVYSALKITQVEDPNLITGETPELDPTLVVEKTYFPMPAYTPDLYFFVLVPP